MASPPARSDSVLFLSSLLRFFAEFTARQVRDGDAFQPARRDQDSPNEGMILQVPKTIVARLEQGAKEDETKFFLDSGASVHAVGDFSLLSSFTPAGGSAAAGYRARDGRRLAIGGVGTISRGSFHLSDVLHVPGLPVGVVLVSVTQLAKRGYLVVFGGGRCHVKDQSTGDMVGNGRLHSQDGLYHLEFLKIPPDDTTDTTADTRFKNSETNRLQTDATTNFSKKKKQNKLQRCLGANRLIQYFSYNPNATAKGTTTDPDHQIAVLGELTQRHQVRSELRNVPDIRNVPDSSSMISLSSMP